MYNVKSLKAEEFINHDEIIETLAYADENKDNLALVDEIIKKAEDRKGLTHREASVLLACQNEERIWGTSALPLRRERTRSTTPLNIFWSV